MLVRDTAARLVLSDIVSGLPEKGSAHSTFPALYLSGYGFREHSPGELIREIECTYEAEENDDGEGGEGEETPGRITALDYPAYTQTGDLVADQITGATVLNSAGDAFDSVPQIESVAIGVHFVRRVAAFPAAALALAGTVNTNSVRCYGITFAPRTARLKIGCRNTLDNSRRPYELDITLEPRHNYVSSGGAFLPSGVESGYASVPGRGYDFGWDVCLLECGYQYKDTGGNKIRFTVADENGAQTAPQLPQLLTSDGRSNQNGAYPNAYLVVRTAAGSDWAALDLPPEAL